ncbi:unnamed protein product, partial [Scytosiphon promiscuus]
QAYTVRCASYRPGVRRLEEPMRPLRLISRCGCYGTDFIRHTSLRRQASSGATTMGLSEARKQQKENESWAKQSGAREVMVQPPFNAELEEESASAIGADLPDSLELYLQARRWHHPEGPARRFLSHLLTFPLTLAAGLHAAGLGSASSTAVSTAPTTSQSGADPPRAAEGSGGGGGDSSNSSSGRRLAVVCLGARAESSMPPAFWRETLFVLPGVSHLTLHLIGPELSLPAGLAPSRQRHPTQETDGDGIGTKARRSPPPTTSTAISVGSRTADIRWTRALLGGTAGAQVAGGEGGAGDGSGVGKGSGVGASSEPAAAAVVVDEAVARADAFVLFNPGLGHPHLREGWDGALKRLLATGKPIVVSCHSRKDLDRDASLLREAGAVPSCRSGGVTGEDEE